jgi:transcriptional regulator with XRE-family HTH domain
MTSPFGRYAPSPVRDGAKLSYSERRIIVKLRTKFCGNGDEKGATGAGERAMIHLHMPKVTEPATALGAAIRHARKNILHLSQEKLGEKLGVENNVISRWETGVNKPPVESLARLAGLAATSKAEELRLYSEWVHLAGYPRPQIGTPGASEQETTPAPRTAVDAAHPETVEGQMARAIVDFISDPDLRVQLVLHLRQAAQQWQANAGGRALDQDH